MISIRRLAMLVMIKQVGDHFFHFSYRPSVVGGGGHIFVNFNVICDAHIVAVEFEVGMLPKLADSILLWPFAHAETDNGAGLVLLKMDNYEISYEYWQSMYSWSLRIDDCQGRLKQLSRLRVNRNIVRPWMQAPI